MVEVEENKASAPSAQAWRYKMLRIIGQSLVSGNKLQSNNTRRRTWDWIMQDLNIWFRFLLISIKEPLKSLNFSRTSSHLSIK